MDPELQRRLDAQDKKLDEIYRAAERTRKYLLWTFVITVIFIVLPALGLLFAVPQFISTYSNVGGL